MIDKIKQEWAKIEGMHPDFDAFLHTLIALIAGLFFGFSFVYAAVNTVIWYGRESYQRRIKGQPPFNVLKWSRTANIEWAYPSLLGWVGFGLKTIFSVYFLT